MFLSYLEEKNKEKFKQLCVFAATANDVFVKEEKEMLEAYCREMNVSAEMPVLDVTIDELFSDIAESTSDAEKNIIVLEIMGLVKADDVYDDKEKAFMQKLVKEIGVKEGLLSKLESLLEIYSCVCRELYTAITE